MVIFGPNNTFAPCESCNTASTYFWSLNIQKPTFCFALDPVTFAKILKVEYKNLLKRGSKRNNCYFTFYIYSYN